MDSIPGHVVADEAEASDARVILHDAAEGGLRVLRHAVRLVEDDDFIWRSWVIPVSRMFKVKKPDRVVGRNGSARVMVGGDGELRKAFDLVAHDRDPALI